MIVLNPADRNLLMRVLETEPDLSRKGNPRLRPLSLYSTELKNLKQVAAAVERASNGQALHATGTTAKRYGNTLSNLGIWSGGDRSTNVGAAGEKLLQLAQTNNGDATVFWNQNTRAWSSRCLMSSLNKLSTKTLNRFALYFYRPLVNRNQRITPTSVLCRVSVLFASAARSRQAVPSLLPASILPNVRLHPYGSSRPLDATGPSDHADDFFDDLAQTC